MGKMHLKALQQFLNPTKWEGTNDDEFVLTHELKKQETYKVKATL